MRILDSSTLQALNEAAQPSEAIQEDRRNSQRVQTVYRIARVRTGSDEGLARVQNISDDGVMLQMHLPVHLGDTLIVEMLDGVTISGRVVWTRGVHCGIKLNETLDCAALLTALAAQSQSRSSRPFRLSVVTAATTRGDNGLRAVEIRDVSQRGMKIKHDGSFSEGLHVKVTLQSGMERRGVVRWSRDDLAGLMLLEPFSPENLGSINKL